MQNVLMYLLETYSDCYWIWGNTSDVNYSWDWLEISANPNITVDFIKKNMRKMYLDNILRNEFQCHLVLQKRKREKIKQSIIKEIPSKHEEFEKVKHKLNYDICIDFIKIRGRDFQNGKRIKML